METLFAKQDRLLMLTSTEIVRTLMHRINWNAQLIAIRGPRGVGKTTLMLQYIKQHYEAYNREALYCTLDSVYFLIILYWNWWILSINTVVSTCSWMKCISTRLGAKR